jgi:hypothetical protein
MPVTPTQILSATLALLTLLTFIFAFTSSQPHRSSRPCTKQEWHAWRLSKKAERETLRSEGRLRTMPESRKRLKRKAKDASKYQKTLERKAVRAFEDRVERGFPNDVEEDVEESDDGGVQEDAGKQASWGWLCRVWSRLWRRP